MTVATKEIELISVHAVGSTVYLAGEIEAQVTQVCIAEDGITYEVVWWTEKDRKCEWLKAFEVSAGKESRCQCIGFRGNGTRRSDDGTNQRRPAEADCGADDIAAATEAEEADNHRSARRTRPAQAG